MTDDVMKNVGPLDQLLSTVNADFDNKKEARRKKRNKRKAALRKARQNKNRK